MFPFSFFILFACLFALVRLILRRTALIYLLQHWTDWIEDAVHVHQFFKVPEFNDNTRQNQFYSKVSVYLNSLPAIEDSDFTSLLSGKNLNDIVLALNHNQIVCDTFLGARVKWIIENEKIGEENCRRRFVLKMKRNDKRRILRPYLQHIHTVSDDIEQRRREVKLYMNTDSDRRWRSVPFTHPCTMDTIAMDPDLKTKVKSDLELFLKSKQYYHRLGRVWKRSYLLYGPSGTGKSSFIAAMAKFLGYDVYDIDLSKVSDDSDLKMLLLQTTKKSLIVVEDLDRFLSKKSTSVSLTGLLNFMDGIVNSSSGGEKVMVFTMNSKVEIDQAILRPGRIDVHIYFPLCDFRSFKALANSYLGLKDHKLFPQVEGIFMTGATMSPAEIGELMIVNRSSPSRALKSVITALQSNGDVRVSAKMMVGCSESDESGDYSGVLIKERTRGVKEFKKLYGLLKIKSSKRFEPSDHHSGMIER
jgi:chaperone BCS1